MGGLLPWHGVERKGYCRLATTEEKLREDSQQFDECLDASSNELKDCKEKVMESLPKVLALVRKSRHWKMLKRSNSAKLMKRQRKRV